VSEPQQQAADPQAPEPEDHRPRARVPEQDHYSRAPAAEPEHQQVPEPGHQVPEPEPHSQVPVRVPELHWRVPAADPQAPVPVPDHRSRAPVPEQDPPAPVPDRHRQAPAAEPVHCPQAPAAEPEHHSQAPAADPQAPVPGHHWRARVPVLVPVRHWRVPVPEPDPQVPDPEPDRHSRAPTVERTCSCRADWRGSSARHHCPEQLPGSPMHWDRCPYRTVGHPRRRRCQGSPWCSTGRSPERSYSNQARSHSSWTRARCRPRMPSRQPRRSRRSHPLPRIHRAERQIPANYAS
jgi:hypothetical protein